MGLEARGVSCLRTSFQTCFIKQFRSKRSVLADAGREHGGHSMSEPDLSLRDVAVAVAGAGRVGTALGRLLADRGMPVTALWSRNEAKARAAAAFISPSTQVTSLEELPRYATHLLIAVSDDATETVSKRVAAGADGTEIALHTSGILDWRALGPLFEKGASCGSIHPLQTVPSPERGVELLPGSLFAVEGASAAVKWAEEIARRLDGKILLLRPQAKPLYHAAATLAGNGVIALVAAAERILSRGGFTEAEARSLLQPLMHASLSNAVSLGPPAALTGPVARGDLGTLGQHLQALAGCEGDVRELYRAIAFVLFSVAGSRRGESKEWNWAVNLSRDSERLP
jgi:predicted short-subunit dehydrogenase-like oxidoreductase (DUF2520 family)